MEGNNLFWKNVCGFDWTQLGRRWLSAHPLRHAQAYCQLAGLSLFSLSTSAHDKVKLPRRVIVHSAISDRIITFEVLHYRRRFGWADEKGAGLSCHTWRAPPKAPGVKAAPWLVLNNTAPTACGSSATPFAAFQQESHQERTESLQRVNFPVDGHLESHCFLS